MKGMELLVFHHHWRPGGVRRVVELALPFLVRGGPGRVDRVRLISGESPDAAWQALITSEIGMPVEFHVDAAFGYYSEQRVRGGDLRRRVRDALGKVFAPAAGRERICWVHNPGLGRNLVFTRELMRRCDRSGVRLVAHHHDWWFEQRWQRWPELREAGFGGLSDVAEAVFGSGSARHAAINGMDAAVLRRHVGRRAGWVPNLASRAEVVSSRRRRAAARWLEERLPGGGGAWLLPARMLRRKNVAEALLLTRWLRPEAWLVTTGGVSSADEQPYHDRLAAAAAERGWRIRLGILASSPPGAPGVSELMAASEAVVMTSVQEGFGLPYLEAIGAGRPLLGRRLSNVAPDLARFGFRFGHLYDELLIAPVLFDWESEWERQGALFRHWKRGLPAGVRREVGVPVVLRHREPVAVPFSRLTLSAQLEVLSQPVDRSWDLCRRLNPFLERWRQRASAGKLRADSWPAGADRWLSGEVYARRFWQLMGRGSSLSRIGSMAAAARRRRSRGLQSDLIRLKSQTENLYPLLWTTNP